MTTTPNPDPLASITDNAIQVDEATARIVAAADAARTERAAQGGILAGVREELTAALNTIRTLRQRIEELENPAPAARFPGDPGKGNYRMGVALERGTTSGWDLAEAMARPWFNDKITVIHDYARSTAKFLDTTSAQGIIDAGFPVVSQSMKLGGLPGTWAEKCRAVLAGTHDAALNEFAAFLKAHPLIAFWLCIYHEPEDLTGDNAKLLRQVTRYVVFYLRQQGVTNVAWQPIYQNPYTFPNRDFRLWHADWKGTTTTANPAADWHTGTERTMDMLGLDTYNPLPPSSGVTGRNRPYAADMMKLAEDHTKAAGFPYDETPKCEPEFGFGRINTTDQAPPEGWVRYAEGKRDYDKARDVVATVLWDNSDDIGRYRLEGTTGASPSWQQKRAGWDLLCAGATV